MARKVNLKSLDAMLAEARQMAKRGPSPEQIWDREAARWAPFGLQVETLVGSEADAAGLIAWLVDRFSWRLGVPYLVTMEPWPPSWLKGDVQIFNDAATLVRFLKLITVEQRKHICADIAPGLVPGVVCPPQSLFKSWLFNIVEMRSRLPADLAPAVASGLVEDMRAAKGEKNVFTRNCMRCGLERVRGHGSVCPHCGDPRSHGWTDDAAGEWREIALKELEADAA